MPATRTSRSYTRLTNDRLAAFSGTVITGLKGSADFPTPPVTTAELTTLQTAFNDAVVKAAGGGRVNIAARNAARDALVAALDKDASYVDIACDGDLTKLLSSGYTAVSTNRAQTVLPQPQVLAVNSPQTGELKMRVRADRNAKSYVGRIKEATGSEFGPSISFKNSKSILFDGLKAGVTYVMQLCAVGGSTGQSDWSEPVSKMAM